jgi:hypothetical protein
MMTGIFFMRMNEDEKIFEPDIGMGVPNPLVLATSDKILIRRRCAISSQLSQEPGHHRGANNLQTRHTLGL